jgi:hypothetical protein
MFNIQRGLPWYIVFISLMIYLIYKIINVWTKTILWNKILCIFKYSDYFPWLISLIFTGILQRCLDYEVTMYQAMLNTQLCC